MRKKIFFFLVLFSFVPMTFGMKNERFTGAQGLGDSQVSLSLQLGEASKTTLRPASWKQWAYMKVPGASLFLNCDHMAPAKLVKKCTGTTPVPFGLEAPDQKGVMHFSSLKIGDADIINAAQLTNEFNTDVVVSATRTRKGASIKNRYYVPRKQAQDSIAVHNSTPVDVTLGGQKIQFYAGNRKSGPEQRLCFGWLDSSLFVTTERKTKGKGLHIDYFNIPKNNQYEAAK